MFSKMYREWSLNLKEKTDNNYIWSQSGWITITNTMVIASRQGSPWITWASGNERFGKGSNLAGRRLVQKRNLRLRHSLSWLRCLHNCMPALQAHVVKAIAWTNCSIEINMFEKSLHITFLLTSNHCGLWSGLHPLPTPLEFDELPPGLPLNINPLAARHELYSLIEDWCCAITK